MSSRYGSQPVAEELLGMGVRSTIGRRLILSGSLVLAIFAAVPGRSSQAYELHTFRGQKSDVRYSVADQRLDSSVAQAMGLWGRSSALDLSPGGNDITVVVAPLVPPFYAGQPAQANVAHDRGAISSCEV